MALDFNDKSGNGNALTNSGASETVDTPFAASTEAISLVRASSQYLTTPHSSSLNITGDITTEAWINPASVPSTDSTTHTILSKYNDNLTTNESWIFSLFYKPAVGLGVALVIVKNGATSKLFFKAQAISTGTWTHIAAVFTAASKQVEFFINGVSIGTDTDASTDAIQASSSTDVEVGAFRGGAVENWDGKLDELRIWNLARTSTQIANNYNAELIGIESGLVAYWPFESVIATTSTSTTTTSTSTTTTSTSTSTTTTSTSTSITTSTSTSTTHTTTSTSTTTTSTSTSSSTTITVTSTSTSSSTSTSTSTTTTFPLGFEVDSASAREEILSFSVDGEQQ